MAIVVKRMAPLLQVFDMPTALAFYRDALGFEVVEHLRVRSLRKR